MRDRETLFSSESVSITATSMSRRICWTVFKPSKS